MKFEGTAPAITCALLLLAGCDDGGSASQNGPVDMMSPSADAGARDGAGGTGGAGQGGAGGGGEGGAGQGGAGGMGDADAGQPDARSDGPQPQPMPDPEPRPDFVLSFAGEAAEPGAVGTLVVEVEAATVGLVGLQFDVRRDEDGRLSLRPEDAMPPGVSIGLDADEAGKDLDVVELPDGWSRVTIFALSIDPIADVEGDGIMELARLHFDIAADAPPGEVMPVIERVVLTDGEGRSNTQADGLVGEIVETGIGVQ